MGTFGQPVRASGFVARDLVAALEREADVVEPVQQTVLRVVVELERLVEVDGRDGDAPVDDVDHDLDRRVVLDDAHDARHDVLRQLDRHETDLQAVVAEDVGEARRDDGPEAVVLERPDGVLARRAGAEVRPGDQDRRAPA